MGVSTDGEISFGVVFEDGFEFPWRDDDFDYELETWWKSINGFTEKYDGDYEAYRAKKDKFYAEYPLPVELVNYCSGEYPMYLLAVPGVGTSCSRGNPTDFNPLDLTVTDEQKQALMDFINKYLADAELSEEEIEPKWYLTSYWG